LRPSRLCGSNPSPFDVRCWAFDVLSLFPWASPSHHSPMSVVWGIPCGHPDAR
jgi:hypothetical protein